ncbi:MAG: hypothetical protein WCP79_14370 [Bacillota bacterium]
MKCDTGTVLQGYVRKKSHALHVRLKDAILMPVAKTYLANGVSNTGRTTISDSGRQHFVEFQSHFGKAAEILACRLRTQ